MMLTLLIGVTPTAQAEKYAFNAEKSSVAFTLKHLGITTMKGDFKAFEGHFRFDPAAIDNSWVKLEIQTASLKSNNAKRERDLKSKNFFWPEKYPAIHFISHEIQSVDGKKFNIHGDLTIRGVTNPVVFKTELRSPPEELKEGVPVNFTTWTYIKRSDYHLGTGSFLDPLMFMTGERLKLSLEVVGLPEVSGPQHS